VTVTTIRLSDKLRAACLRIAMQNKQVVDVIGDDGDTIRGRVLAIDVVNSEQRWSTNAEWIVLVETAA
jgi:hypothetical protein